MSSSRSLPPFFAVPAMLAVSCLLSASHVAAQTPEAELSRVVATPEAIGSLVQSADARDRAWGAWYAGAHQVFESAPGLHTLVQQELGAASTPEDDAVLDAALDALIQLEPHLPVNLQATEPLLLQIARRRPVQALVLSSTSRAQPRSFWMSMLGNYSGELWFAAADLLTEKAPQTPGLALYLLIDIHLDGVLVAVHNGDMKSGVQSAAPDPWQEPVPSVAGRPLPGFPPASRYELRAGSAGGQIVVGAGPTPVSYLRRPAAPGAGGEAPTGARKAVTSDRLAYLTRLTRLTASPVAPKEYRLVKWVDQETLDNDIQAFRQDFRERHGRLVQALVDQHLLTVREKASIPEPTIQIAIEHRGR